VSVNDAAKVAGNLAFYGSLAVLGCELLLGALMDKVGRKYTSIVGLAIAGVATVFMPLFSMPVSPYLYILRVVQELGMVPNENSPLYLDYIA
jgi:MFS family permease